MSPLYNSQAISNSPLQAIFKGDAVLPLLFNAETPAAGQASIAVAIAPNTQVGGGGVPTLSFQFECPLGMVNGVFQIQTSEVDTANDYVSENFNNATPGQVAAANLNASNVGRVELQIAARFARVLCITAPGNPVTVRVGQK